MRFLMIVKASPEAEAGISEAIEHHRKLEQEPAWRK
jgi:hypothetical protein